MPTDGPLKIEEVQGEYFIVGHSSWERCASGEHARRRLSERVQELSPERLAAAALEVVHRGCPDGLDVTGGLKVTTIKDMAPEWMREELAADAERKRLDHGVKVIEQMGD